MPLPSCRCEGVNGVAVITCCTGPSLTDCEQFDQGNLYTFIANVNGSHTLSLCESTNDPVRRRS